MALGTASLALLHHRLALGGDTLGWVFRHGDVPLYHLRGAGDFPHRSNTLLRNNPGDSAGFADCFALGGHGLLNRASYSPTPPCHQFMLPTDGSLVTRFTSKLLTKKLPLAAPHLMPPSLVPPGLLRQSQPVNQSWLVYFKCFSIHHSSYYKGKSRKKLHRKNKKQMSQ